jgi:hypothetical protein
MENRTITLVPVPECDLARGPGRLSIHVRTLHSACRVLGSLGALAGQLQASEDEVRAWLAGDEDPPYRVFLVALEILLLAVEQPGARN